MLEEMLELRAPCCGIILERPDSALAGMTVRGVLPVCVCGQNARIIIQRTTGRFVVESFKVSPMNIVAMQYEGRLRWSSFTLSSMDHPGLQRTCSALISCKDEALVEA